MKPFEKQFWRVLNASADTIIDLRLQYDGVAQPLSVVALDGVPTGSQDGTAPGATVTMTDILLPPPPADRSVRRGLVLTYLWVLLDRFELCNLCKKCTLDRQPLH